MKDLYNEELQNIKENIRENAKNENIFIVHKLEEQTPSKIQTMQSNLQTECNPNQNTNDVFFSDLEKWP